MNKKSSKSILFGKKILIGVSGSIAAYKIPEIVRLFIKNGAEVKIILTRDAVSFVTPLTLSTLSKNSVTIDLIDTASSQWNNHVDLSLWADVFLIAPATANTISKMANGICDNMLLATFLSSKCPVFCVPAMDRDMYLNRATLKNIDVLKKRSIHILDVEEGELASGIYGLGRMHDVQKIFHEIEIFFTNSMPLFGQKFLITAGPTYERLDPVRFIGNFSSGKMGCALAREAAQLGANVDLVLGPSFEEVRHPLINKVSIQSANEMLMACEENFQKCDIAIFAAAVSDFKPKSFSQKKIKNKDLIIETVKNKDIVKTLVANKKKHQFIVGFALETHNQEKNAVQKMMEKKMDLIILNSLNNRNPCFNSQENKITIIDQSHSIKKYPLMKKTQVAKIILDEIIFKKSYESSIKKIL